MDFDAQATQQFIMDFDLFIIVIIFNAIIKYYSHCNNFHYYYFIKLVYQIHPLLITLIFFSFIKHSKKVKYYFFFTKIKPMNAKLYAKIHHF